MKFYILILLFLDNLQADDSQESSSTKTSFENAVLECNVKGGELLTMSTYSEFVYSREYIYTHLQDESWSWLALVKNTTTGNYQWSNGRVLTELKWLSGEPKNYNGTDCGVMDVDSRRWYTTLCTDNKHYLCVGSDGSYSFSSTSVDFYTAVLNCQSEGRQLPVAITNLDTKWLNDAITNRPISTDFWLGLRESGTNYGDYYRWITGEHLTPPYTWADNYRYDKVYYHRDGSNEMFHSCNDCGDRDYICQTKSTTDNTAAVVRSPDKFVLVSNNALVLGSIRQATTINSLRRFQCALECLRDACCIQYTIQGHLCRTFGEGLVITDYNGGYKLWQRKIIS